VDDGEPVTAEALDALAAEGGRPVGDGSVLRASTGEETDWYHKNQTGMDRYYEADVTVNPVERGLRSLRTGAGSTSERVMEGRSENVKRAWGEFQVSDLADVKGWKAWGERALNGATASVIQFLPTRIASVAGNWLGGVKLGDRELAKQAIAAADLEAGRLVAPFASGSTPIDFGYWLVWPKGRHLSPEVRAFIKWIKDEAASSEVVGV
jgi:hypothetical protein